MSNALEVAQQYFDGWNNRDPQAVLAVMADGGTYEDPGTGGPISGDALAGYMGGLFEMLPDISFEIASAGEAQPGLVAAEWIMRGTNTGPLMELPPSGKSIEVRGCDFIRVEGDKVRSVRGYFNAGDLPRQAGLRVDIQPSSLGPMTFGTANRMAKPQDGAVRKAKPGAMSVTVLEVRTPEEINIVRQQAQQVAQEMMGMRGFQSLVGVTVGDRMMTISAWESPEDPAQLMRGGAHGEAMKGFFGDLTSRGGVTGVWIPERINQIHTRCSACGKMTNHDAAGGKCGCGADLPEEIAYW